MEEYCEPLRIFAARHGDGKTSPFPLAVVGAVWLAYGGFILWRDVVKRRPESSEKASFKDVVGGILSFRGDGPPIPGGWALFFGGLASVFGLGLVFEGLRLPGGDLVFQFAAWTAVFGAWSAPRRLWRQRWRPTSADESASPETRLQPWLAEGEKILWSGKPEPARFRNDSLGIAYIGVIAACAGVALGVSSFRNYVLQDYPLRLVPWTLLGLEAGACLAVFGAILIRAPWELEEWTHEIVYAVTDRRGLLLSPGGWFWTPVPVRSSAVGAPMEFSPKEMLDRKRVKYGRDREELVFVTEVVGSGRRQTIIRYGFHGLERPEDAEEWIERAFGSPSKSSAMESK